MKKYIFICLITCVNLCYAQQTKPTKEQTVAFIKDWFEARQQTAASCTDGGYRVSLGFNTMDIKFMENNSKFTLYFEHYQHFTPLEAGDSIYSKSKRKYIVDLKKIQQVLSYNDQLSEIRANTLLFEASGDYKIEEFLVNDDQSSSTKKFSDLTLPSTPSLEKKQMRIVVSFKLSDNVNDVNELVKAFNHLRKLNGAPEVNKFD